MTIQYRKKNVYGNELNYPACEVSNKFADLLGIKSFTATQIKKIEALGYNFVQVI